MLGAITNTRNKKKKKEREREIIRVNEQISDDSASELFATEDTPYKDSSGMTRLVFWLLLLITSSMRVPCCSFRNF
jgi:hypothetical protein